VTSAGAASTALLLSFALTLPGAARAQEAQPALFAVDTVAAFDLTADPDGNRTAGVIVDAVVSADFGRGFEAFVRPFLQRLGNTGEWNRQVWIAALRYERATPLGLRVDAGLIPSPIGLANLTLRPHVNPTIAQPSSLFTPLPPVEPRGARATLLGAVYAFGGQATLSSEHWDVRGAVIDTSPLRTRRIFGDNNPPRFMNLVVGGGITPIVGVRVGGSLTHGGWQRAGESPAITADRSATVLTIESEVAFRHTDLRGEWIRDNMETSAGPRVATGWYIQGQQTLTPRWFAAGRLEAIEAPAVFWLGGAVEPPLVVQQRLRGVEETIGYRLTPEITLRAAHRARERFGQTRFDHTFSVSMVWWRRWV
jgi:hypothetical protein